MPSYDYRCHANNRIYEARHSISEKAATWGELCQLADIDPEDIALETPVSRLISAAGVVNSGVLKNPELPPCAQGERCLGGSCGV